MTISTDPVQETLFRLKQHRPFSLTLTCEKQDKSRVSLAGCSLRLVIVDLRHKGGAVRVSVDATLVSAADGTARFDVQADELSFDPGIYDMAITLTSAEGYASTIVEGEVELTYNPDPTVPVDHGGVVPPLSLTATLRDTNQVSVRVHHHPDSVLLDAELAATTSASAAGISADEAAASAAAAAASATAAEGTLGDFGDLLDQAVDDATAAAAASAAAAAASAVNASAANTSAATHSSNAETAATTVTGLVDDAEAAATTALAANTSAATHASNANDYAVAAEGSATYAGTKAGEAEASADAAAASAAAIDAGNYITSNTVTAFVILSQAAYDGLPGGADPDTVYFIQG